MMMRRANTNAHAAYECRKFAAYECRNVNSLRRHGELSNAREAEEA